MTEGAGPRRRDGHGVLRGKFLGRGCFAREGTGSLLSERSEGRVCHYNSREKRRDSGRQLGEPEPAVPLRGPCATWEQGWGLPWGRLLRQRRRRLGRRLFACRGTSPKRPGESRGSGSGQLQGRLPSQASSLAGLVSPRVAVWGKESTCLAALSRAVWLAGGLGTAVSEAGFKRRLGLVGWDCLLFLPALLGTKRESFVHWKLIQESLSSQDF